MSSDKHGWPPSRPSPSPLNPRTVTSSSRPIERHLLMLLMPSCSSHGPAHDDHTWCTAPRAQCSLPVTALLLLLHKQIPIKTAPHVTRSDVLGWCVHGTPRRRIPGSAVVPSADMQRVWWSGDSGAGPGRVQVQSTRVWGLAASATSDACCEGPAAWLRAWTSEHGQAQGSGDQRGAREGRGRMCCRRIPLASSRAYPAPLPEQQPQPRPPRLPTRCNRAVPGL